MVQPWRSTGLNSGHAGASLVAGPFLKIKKSMGGSGELHKAHLLAFLIIINDGYRPSIPYVSHFSLSPYLLFIPSILSFITHAQGHQHGALPSLTSSGPSWRPEPPLPSPDTNLFGPAAPATSIARLRRHPRRLRSAAISLTFSAGQGASQSSLCSRVPR
jgi:hypothetical protein